MAKLTLKGNDGHIAVIQTDATTLPGIIEWRGRHYVLISDREPYRAAKASEFMGATYSESNVRIFTDAEVTLLPDETRGAKQ